MRRWTVHKFGEPAKSTYIYRINGLTLRKLPHEPLLWGGTAPWGSLWEVILFLSLSSLSLECTYILVEFVGFAVVEEIEVVVVVSRRRESHGEKGLFVEN